MPYYLSKVLPLLLLPVSIALVAALLALVFILKRKRIASIVSLLVAILVLVVFSQPVVASWLTWSLEKQFPPVALDDVRISDCLIVLGGAVGAPVRPRVDIDLTESSDRIYQAARLYRNGKAKTIIVAAGNQPWNRDRAPEAQLILHLLVEWGVPQSSIVLDSSSKNTYENAVNSRKLLSQLGCESTLLITSAWHMPRAVASFRRVGLDVVPISVDIRLVKGGGDDIAKFIPQADALGASSLAIREWMGIFVYRWRGWN